MRESVSVKQMIREVSARHGVDFAAHRGKRGSDRVNEARRELYRTVLSARPGKSSNELAMLLGCDGKTVRNHRRKLGLI